MIIHVLGEDSFRAKEKVKQLREHFCAKFDANADSVVVFAERPTISDLAGAVSAMGLFSTKRFVVLRNLVSLLKAEEARAYAAVLLRAGADSIVVLQDDISLEDAKKKPLYKELLKAGDRHEYAFALMSPREAVGWLVQAAKEDGATITQDAASEMINLRGTDTWTLSNELAKLSAISGGNITKEHVVAHVSRIAEENIFGLVDNFFASDKRTALSLLYEEREAGSEDEYILALLNKHIRGATGTMALLAENKNVSQQQISDFLGIHPFVAKKLLNLAKKATFSSFKKLHSKLFCLDWSTKTGRSKAEKAVEELLVKT